MKQKLALLLFAFIFVCTAEAQTKTGITVVLPEGWTKVEGSVLEHQYMKDGASFMIKEENLLNGKSLSEATSTAKVQIEKYFKEVEYKSDEALTIDGHQAQRLDFCYAIKVGNSSIKMRMHSIYVMVNNKCYNISIGGMATQFDALASDIPVILKNIKFNQK
ncbi:MAG: hypothetical protein H6543_01965 [Prevotellaceae bacterium]|nr:hypothetical protein [Prevotellaceae bacterium]